MVSFTIPTSPRAVGYAKVSWYGADPLITRTGGLEKDAAVERQSLRVKRLFSNLRTVTSPWIPGLIVPSLRPCPIVLGRVVK